MALKCMSAKAAKVTLSIGIIILGTSVALMLVFPFIYKTKLKEDLTLTNGSLLTKIWSDIPLPLYEKLYFFNITNRDDFMNNGAPLNVTEVGPYVYKGRWVKDDPQWNENGTVSYREVRTYQFVRDMSAGSQDDDIYTLNGPLIIAADALNKNDIFLKSVAEFYLSHWGGDLVINKKIRELVYDAYEDSIIKKAAYIRDDIPYKDGRFSWLYGKNGTDDGLFTVFTGAEDRSQTDILNNWNGKEKLSFWENDTCNMLNGTNIEVGPPLPDHPETYSFFQSIFCRSLTFDYTGDHSILGVNTKRFEPSSWVFANSSDNPENKCFEVSGTRPSGVLDISRCQFDAPVRLSFPHFLMADPSYLDFVSNLDPNTSSHGSYVGVEPITGLSVDVKIRFQINLELNKIPAIKQFTKIKEGIYPILWVGIEIQITDEWASFLESKLKNPIIIFYSVSGILCLVSLALIIISAIILYSSKHEADRDPLIKEKKDFSVSLEKDKTFLPSEVGSVNYTSTEKKENF